MCWFSFALGIIAVAGIGQAIFGYVVVRRFARRAALPVAGSAFPPISVLKPLHGDEPLLEAALASVLGQHYGAFQVVFGVQDRDDAALAVVSRLRTRFPRADIAVVVDAAQHGLNRKIGNLINILPAARHDLLVIADSDVHVAPDYLQRIAAELAEPGAGLVTTVYGGIPANESLPATLGATMISHSFLPGALMARALGRQDCLGATMALRRETLEAVGGLPALVQHIADDHVLGKLVRRLGLDVRVAATLTSTTVPEGTMPELYSHELRWSRTILALVPREYITSFIQYPLFWAATAIGSSGGADWALALFVVSWMARGLAARGIDRSLAAVQTGFTAPAPIWLLPLRDLMCMIVALASYAGDKVEWRGRVMHTTPATPAEPADEYAGEYRPTLYTPPNYAAQGYATRSLRDLVRTDTP